MTTDIGLPRPRVYAKQTFFKLLLAGYASDVKPERVPRFEGDPGTKRNTWKGDQKWHGIDEWRTCRLGDGSNGTTSIYYGSDLIWEMQYGGSYPDEAIPFLREALHVNYSASIWLGGRGPELYENETYRYRNKCTAGENFDEFNGVEYIEKMVNEEWVLLGKHAYRGGFLFPDGWC